MAGFHAVFQRTPSFLAFASLFADISTEMLYPVLPVFLTQTLKVSGSIVGLVDGFAQAVQNIVQASPAHFRTSCKNEKASRCPAISGRRSLGKVFGARLLNRIGAGTRSLPRDALIASSVDEKDRGRAFGLEGFGDNAGAFLGPLLAVFLLYTLHFGIRTIFYVAVIPGLLAAFMVLLVKEQRAAVTAKAKSMSACVRRKKRNLRMSGTHEASR